MALAAYPRLWLLGLHPNALETGRLLPDDGHSPSKMMDQFIIRNCLCLALLPAVVAWPPLLPEAPVVSYTAFSPLPGLPGGLFLWPDPAGYPAPGVARRRALWSADFPLN